MWRPSQKPPPCKKLDLQKIARRHGLADSCPEGRDYDKQLCPRGWSEIGDGFCVRGDVPKTAAKCGSKYHFAGMNVRDKEDLAASCLLEWPCLESCARDYTARCPEGWAHIGEGLCTAPPTYAGDCSYSVNTTGMRDRQKLAFENKCSVPFPCLGRSTTNTAGTSVTAHLFEDGPIEFGIGRVVAAAGGGETQVRDEVRTMVPFLDTSMPSGAITSHGDIKF